MKKLIAPGLALGVGLALPDAAEAQIKLGLGEPITGPNAAFGARLKNGVEQAVEDTNTAPGSLSRRPALSAVARRSK